MLDSPFSPWPSYTQEEIDAVSAVLRSNRVNYWTGNECRKFEAEFSEWCGVSRAVAVANGTVALELALRALRIGPGHEVVVTPRTFLASVSVVVSVGATPVFADVEPDSGNISARTISRALSSRTRAVICVHLAGWPCEMREIMGLADENGFAVVEDCAQAHGARYEGLSVGSIGHVSAWSFCQDKIITTGGEGGMVTTNDDALWRAMWSLKDHGKSYSAVYERQQPPGFRWVHESFGTNWRLTEMQATLGRIQLRRMQGWSERRRRNAEAIRQVCRDLPAVRVPDLPGHAVHAHYKCYVYVRPERLKQGWSRDRVMAEINSRGVPCFQGSCSEVYKERAFEGTGFRPRADLPIAKDLGETSLMFLVHPTLTDEEIRKTCAVVRDVVKEASL